MTSTTREHSRQRRTRTAKLALAGAALLIAGTSPAHGQDLVHRFIDPSFGGNPFYSDHLLAVANVDRPAAPTTPVTTPTDEELLAQQLRARLLSQLSGNILDSIQNAAVGDTGNFTFGNQTVSFRRTATETTVTFTNTTTGEVNTVVIPGAPAASSNTTDSASIAAAGRRSVSTTDVPPGSVSGITLAGTAPLGTSAGSLIGRTPTANDATPRSAEQALGATGTTLAGSGLAPL
ncbi:curli assembly protein CsgF [Sphingomonas sp.]|jgi:curli production assembly/transport component CsgF|uniref:curli assembly protein CsgF n=1 Tax=Sphingomonas sp. TaxID=28214 RepID=UPI002D80736C|nr:curli assembly protein CsgF [Sphingomonas sp.]HEU0044536.1 curli assembly protein CsgF [Sphingomonas sp.]